MISNIKYLYKNTNPKQLTKVIRDDTNLFDFILKNTSQIECETFSERVYLILNELNNKPLCYCGKPLAFKSIIRGYNEYCSTTCARNSKKTKNNFSLSYKKKSFEEKEKIKNKFKTTCLKKYGVDNPSKSKEIKEKITKNNLEKYGVEYVLQNTHIKNKIKNTNLEKYGVENVSQSEKIKEKKKKNNLEKYGVEYTFQVEEFKEKAKNTNLEKYGVENTFKIDGVKDKIRSTNIKRYGVEYPFQSDLIQDKIKKTNIEIYGFPYSKSNNIRKKQIETKFRSLIYRLRNYVTPCFNIDTYYGANPIFKYKWKCVICGNIVYDHINNGRIPRCFKCFPIISKISIPETELFETIKEHDKIQSDKTVLGNKEIDIYIPHKKLGIEFNGIYWHSELNGKDKNYHLNKTIECEKKDIQLIHVFETEWIEKQDIVESIINSKLGKFENRIYARKCIVEEIPSYETNKFLEENHLQGPDKASIKLGLFYENELVSVMTFGNLHYNKKYQYKLNLFCSKLGYQIIGGASKLWKYFVRTYNPKTVITYADRRYSNGKLYYNLGFLKIGESEPNYFYFKGNCALISSIQIKKHKLDVFYPELTEWENMKYNGYDRIWDCGNHVFEWKK